MNPDLPLLGARALNRAVLARQMLLKAERLTPARALERMGGLQNQYAPSGYIGLWSRVQGFKRTDLTKALERATVVQGTLMRVTIHLVSAHDYSMFAAGLRKARREWWLRVNGAAGRAVDMNRAVAVVRKRLRDGPAKQTELAAALAQAGLPPLASSGVGLWVDLLRVPPSGTWERRRADSYALAETCLDAPQVTQEEGLRHLARRYLQAFGPASLQDLCRWAGVPVPPMASAMKGMRLRRFRDGSGTALIDVPGAPLPPEDTPAPVRFLPTWDAVLLAHARRSQILPEEYRANIFSSKTPHSFPTFLVDGAVAGKWRYEGGRVWLSPFRRLSKSVRNELDEEAQELAAMHSDSRAE